jgi:hypothetical protein
LYNPYFRVCKNTIYFIKKKNIGMNFFGISDLGFRFGDFLTATAKKNAKL